MACSHLRLLFPVVFDTRVRGVTLITRPLAIIGLALRTLRLSFLDDSDGNENPSNVMSPWISWSTKH
ncbi:hypothetical protein Bca52824_002613 [Brassica carinata]|uniref:Uncharacterized protein n=1 Tax=Brassica carinata TaxID=52824 RepID=A0A8X8BEG9_BRACI|nr:hypothetical protein Bca52824_002613 [Brassica carinata]